MKTETQHVVVAMVVGVTLIAVTAITTSRIRANQRAIEAISIECCCAFIVEEVTE